MRYEMMLPHQIRAAIAGNWPVVLPLGVLEYHGEHMAVGMDTLAVVKSLDILEGEMNLVILPPFYYGASSYAVEPPEGNGSLQVGAQALFPFAQEMFTGLLRIGFRNIHFFIHHQSEISPQACRPTWPSSSPRGRRSSPSWKEPAARAGGAATRWPITMPSRRAAMIPSTGSRAIP